MQNQPRFLRLKRLATGLLCNEFSGALLSRVYGDRLPFAGLRIFVPKRGISNRSRAAIFWGIYESAERRFIERYLLPDLPTIELGSSLGGVSSHIAKALQKGQELICVEANPRLVPSLEANLRQHAAHLKTQLMNAAVNYEGPRCRFAVSDDHLVSSLDRDGSMSIEVESIRLKDLDPPAQGRDFQLVCDIEGAESQILAFDRPALANCRRIIIELHDNAELGASIDGLLDGFLTTPHFRVLDRFGPVYVFENAMASGKALDTATVSANQGV